MTGFLQNGKNCCLEIAIVCQGNRGARKELGCCTDNHRRNTVDRTSKRGVCGVGFPQQRRYVQARE